MNICVFCSASDLEEKYTKPATEFARLLAENGHVFIWGGSDSGLMKVMADAAQKSGGRIVGISIELFRERARKGANEMVIAKDLGERKAMMLKRSDIIVMMVGGIGTLDEATEILELKKHKIHEKPIIILNTENFYDGLKIQLERMQSEGFLPMPMNELLYFAETPESAMKYVDEYAKGRVSQHV